MKSLKNYQAVSFPSTIPGGWKQVMLIDSLGLPRYTSYTDFTMALAEVAYSRLSALLNLNCAASDFADITLVKPSIVTNATEHNPEWTVYSSWKQQEKEVINPEMISQHYLLHILTQHHAWDEETAGYVSSEGVFIKANNGFAFYSPGMLDSFKTEVVLHHTTLDDIKKATEQMSESLAFLPDLASLSDEILSQCVDFPDFQTRDLCSNYIFKILVEARDNAKEFVSNK